MKTLCTVKLIRHKYILDILQQVLNTQLRIQTLYESWKLLFISFFPARKRVSLPECDAHVERPDRLVRGVVHECERAEPGPGRAVAALPLAKVHHGEEVQRGVFPDAPHRDAIDELIDRETRRRSGKFG